MFAHFVAKLDEYSHEIRTIFVQISYAFSKNHYARQVCEYRTFCEIRSKLVRISYEFHTNLCEFRPICSFHHCIVAASNSALFYSLVKFKINAFMRLFSKKRLFLGENNCLLMFIDVYRCFHILLHALRKVLGCLVVPFACKLSFRVGVI